MNPNYLFSYISTNITLEVTNIYEGLDYMCKVACAEDKKNQEFEAIKLTHNSLSCLIEPFFLSDRCEVSVVQLSHIPSNSLEVAVLKSLEIKQILPNLGSVEGGTVI